MTSLTPAAARKRWIAGVLRPEGALVIDEGAVRALKEGKSLLPAGIRQIDGRFERGDAVLVKDRDGRFEPRVLQVGEKFGQVPGHDHALEHDQRTLLLRPPISRTKSFRASKSML